VVGVQVVELRGGVEVGEHRERQVTQPDVLAQHGAGTDGLDDELPFKVLDMVRRAGRRHVERLAERDVAPFVYAGAAVLTPALFADAPDGAFSLTRLFDRAADAERLCGLRPKAFECTSARPRRLRRPSGRWRRAWRSE
jgi:hypothetical protein